MDLMEVVQRAQSGDQEAMGELYQQTNQRVYALALRLTGDPELAMDAVQDSYVAASDCRQPLPQTAEKGRALRVSSAG